MRQQLESFDNLCLAYERSTPRGEYIGDERLYDQLHRAEPTVKRAAATPATSPAGECRRLLAEDDRD